MLNLSKQAAGATMVCKRGTGAFMGFEPVQECPTPLDKVLVLEEMIFPQCEKLGQTIIFVRTREIARTLHTAVRPRSSLSLSAVPLGQEGHVTLWPSARS